MRQQHEPEREQRKALDRVAHASSVLRLDGCRSATHWPGWSPIGRRARWRSCRRASGSSGSSSSRRTRAPSVRCRRRWRRSRPRVAQLNRYPDGGGGAAARGAGRAPRRAARAGGAGQRGGRADPALRRGHARPRRRRGLSLAVVPELRHGGALRRRRAAARCRWRAAHADLDALLERAGRPRDQARLPRQPEQPDRRGWWTAPSSAACSTSCPDGPVRARRGLRRIRRPRARGPGAAARRVRRGCACCARSRRSTASRRCAWATRSRRPTWPTRSTGCGRSST